MATLTGTKPKNTYKDLLQVSNSNSGVDGTLRNVSDGEATASALWMSTAQVAVVDGSAAVTGLGFKDDVDNGFYRIGANNWAASAAGAKVMEFDASGAVLLAKQPAFLAVPATAASNATGDGTAVNPVVFGTEIHDRNSDFASNVFTAPVTGIYDFSIGISLDDMNNGTTHTRLLIELVTSNRTYSLYEVNPTGFQATGDVVRLNFSVVGVDMDAADTAQVRLLVDGGTKIVDILTGSFFSGRLVA